CLQQFNNPLTF
nr:immunoglobulin light chain junction region [Macaca mulatta]